MALAVTNGVDIVSEVASAVQSSSLGAPSGVATLNGSSTVVQNPASKGLANGVASLDANATLAVAQIPVVVGQWTKFTKSFSDFSSVGLNTNDIPLFALPVRGVVNKVIIHHTTPFSGGTIASYTVSVGISGTPAKYAVAFDVFQASGNTTFGFNSLTNIEDFGGTTSIVAEAISGGDTLDHATAGSVDIYVNYSTLP